MDNNIFNNALSNTSFITACLDEDDQASVSLTGTASSACVYSNGGINYGHISNWDVSGVTIWTLHSTVVINLIKISVAGMSAL